MAGVTGSVFVNDVCIVTILLHSDTTVYNREGYRESVIWVSLVSFGVM